MVNLVFCKILTAGPLAKNDALEQIFIVVDGQILNKPILWPSDHSC